MSYRRPSDGEEGPDTERHFAPLAQRISEVIGRLAAEPLQPGLYLVATPIGNLADITLRALSVLARADVVYCEDTRHSRLLLQHYGLDVPLRPYHEHNAEAERPRILGALAKDRRIALISDAGTPLVSDPGFKLVREVAAAGHSVSSIPGPSAVLAALTSAGLPTDTFLFAGFLPPRPSGRRTRIGELASTPATLIFFEAPTRLADSLRDLAEVLGPARMGAVARELTKLHEETRRGTLGQLATEIGNEAVKGEIVILVAPPVQGHVSDQKIATEIAKALESLSLRDAARAVADALGVPKARVYDIGLAISKDPKP